MNILVILFKPKEHPYAMSLVVFEMVQPPLPFWFGYG
jgi:hypothetical protein